jgi:PAS domain S-box-containing protein
MTTQALGILAIAGVFAVGAYFWLKRSQRRLLGRMRGLENTVANLRIEASKVARSEISYRSMIETLSMGVTLHDADGVITFANPAALEILGVSADMLIGRRSIDLEGDALSDDGRPLDRAREPITAAIAKRQPVRDVVMGVRGNHVAERIWLLASAEPRLTNVGQIVDIVCTFTDITERRQAHE